MPQCRFVGEEPWLQSVRQGDFSAIPDPFTYAHTLHFSHLLHGYRVSAAMGWGPLPIWANERLAEAERTGRWRGSALKLWLCLFYERRRYRHMDEGDPEGPDLALLDQLCAMLRAKLQVLSDDERAGILRLMGSATRLSLGDVLSESRAVRSFAIEWYSPTNRLSAQRLCWIWRTAALDASPTSFTIGIRRRQRPQIAPGYRNAVPEPTKLEGITMLRRSPIDLSGAGRAADPSVGIFFGAMHNGLPVILHEATALAEAEDYDLCKTHPGGHLEAWEASRRTLSLQGDYDDFPRGRIVYDTQNGQFNVYLDRTLDVPTFRRAITYYFTLPDGFTDFRHDAHYARARHKMVFAPD